jgi:hypothetical protein
VILLVLGRAFEASTGQPLASPRVATTDTREGIQSQDFAVVPRAL